LPVFILFNQTLHHLPTGHFILNKQSTIALLFLQQAPIELRKVCQVLLALEQLYQIQYDVTEQIKRWRHWQELVPIEFVHQNVVLKLPDHVSIIVHLLHSRAEHSNKQVHQQNISNHKIQHCVEVAENEALLGQAIRTIAVIIVNIKCDLTKQLPERDICDRLKQAASEFSARPRDRDRAHPIGEHENDHYYNKEHKVPDHVADHDELRAERLEHKRHVQQAHIPHGQVDAEENPGEDEQRPVDEKVGQEAGDDADKEEETASDV